MSKPAPAALRTELLPAFSGMEAVPAGGDSRRRALRSLPRRSAVRLPPLNRHRKLTRTRFRMLNTGGVLRGDVRHLRLAGNLRGKE